MEETESRVLLVSHRLIERRVSYAGAYEFEDVVCAIDDADLVAIQAAEPRPLPREDLVFSHIRKRTGIAIRREPHRRKVKITKPYELLFVRVMTPGQLDILDSLEGWQENCATKVCWIEELWPGWVQYDKLLRPLQKFDHVFVGLAPTLDPLSNATNRPCSFLAPAVDALHFCPYPNPPNRSIDFYAMGRRSSVTHRSLLDYAKQSGDFTYLYDSARPTTFVEGHEDHRDLLANLIKRSRYFLADRAKANRVDSTGGAQVFGPRFLEGAAAGAVLIGDPPRCDVFDAHFDWPDAIVPLEYDSTRIGEVIDALDADPERTRHARQANITNSLRRHDWLHRWETVLDTVGLRPQRAAIERRSTLERRAAEIESLGQMGLANVILSTRRKRGLR